MMVYSLHRLAGTTAMCSTTMRRCVPQRKTQFALPMSPQKAFLLARQLQGVQEEIPDAAGVKGTGGFIRPNNTPWGMANI
jgi:hypothetical protein